MGTGVAFVSNGFLISGRRLPRPESGERLSMTTPTTAVAMTIPITRRRDEERTALEWESNVELLVASRLPINSRSLRPARLAIGEVLRALPVT